MLRSTTLPICLSAAAFLALSACARHMDPMTLEPGGETGLRAYRPTEVDTAPKLIKCANHTYPPASTISGGRWEYVTVGFIVTETGYVDNNSIFVKSAALSPRHANASPKSIAEAKVLALTCEYEPGILSGQPVRVTVDRTFRILAVL